MIEPLSDVELRVMACLIEKEFTTPDLYPLSLNALTSACNQKSNRDPVVAFDQDTVMAALDSLAAKQLAYESQYPGNRARKFRHFFTERFKLMENEAAILCELMLRGPQTPGELRTRANRLHPFENLQEIEEVLPKLMEVDPPWVVKLPRESGRKEHRYAHLLMGMPDISEQRSSPAPARSGGSPLEVRVIQLETEVAALREQVQEIKTTLAEVL